MHFSDLESLTLLIVRDAGEPALWSGRWEYSYPMVQSTACSAAQSIEQWQRGVQAAFAAIRGNGAVMLVAYGAGALAAAAWYYQTDTAAQRRVAGVILVSPPREAWQDDPYHTLARCRFNCKTALVIGSGDERSPEAWARQQAEQWRARLLVSPHTGRLNGEMGGWQWGMRLMQEMLIY